jgi:hypothetical protein
MRVFWSFFLAVVLMIGAATFWQHASAQDGMKLHAVEVGTNSIVPPGDVVGFSCAAGLQDVTPRCYALIKERE